MTAKEMFENLGYTYKLIDNKNNNCEDVILYEHTINDSIIQFNLLSRLVVYQTKNTMQEYDKIAIFMTKEIIQAINKQCEELGWLGEKIEYN